MSLFIISLWKMSLERLLKHECVILIEMLRDCIYLLINDNCYRQFSEDMCMYLSTYQALSEQLEIINFSFHRIPIKPSKRNILLLFYSHNLISL